MSRQRQKNRPEQGVVQAFPTEQLGRLRDRFLNVPLDGDLDEKLRFYSEAIRLKPDNVEALKQPGQYAQRQRRSGRLTVRVKGDVEVALQDENKAIFLAYKPKE